MEPVFLSVPSPSINDEGFLTILSVRAAQPKHHLCVCECSLPRRCHSGRHLCDRYRLRHNCQIPLQEKRDVSESWGQGGQTGRDPRFPLQQPDWRPEKRLWWKLKGVFHVSGGRLGRCAGVHPGGGCGQNRASGLHAALRASYSLPWMQKWTRKNMEQHTVLTFTVYCVNMEQRCSNPCLSNCKY